MSDILKDLQKYWKDKKYTITCPNCGRIHVKQRPNAKFCSQKCGHNVREKRRYDKKTPGMIKHKLNSIERSKEWRKRMAEQGRCTRCGGLKITDNKVCSKCIQEITEGEWN